ncbi:unnamed protein product [Closterium sp. NIES-54]
MYADRLEEERETVRTRLSGGRGGVRAGAASTGPIRNRVSFKKGGSATTFRRHSTGGSGDQDRWHHDLFDQSGGDDDPAGDGVPPANDLRALLRAKGGNLRGAGGKLGGRLGGKVQVADLRHKLSGGSGGKRGNGGSGASVGKVTRGRLGAGVGGSEGIFAAEGERGGNGEAVARGRGGEGMVVRGRGAVTNISSLSFRNDERVVVGGDVGGVVRVAAAAAAAAAGGRGGGERLVKQQQPRQQHHQQQEQQRRLTVVVTNDEGGRARSIRRRSTVVGAVGVGEERGVTAMNADVAMEGGDEQQTVASFLASLGLSKYTDLFVTEEIDLQTIHRMSENDLKEIGIPMGPRKKIVQANAAA